MLMPSNGLSLSQWDSSYTNWIAAPLTSKSRIETTRQSSTVMGDVSTRKVDSSTKVGVGGGSEVETVDWMSNG